MDAELQRRLAPRAVSAPTSRPELILGPPGNTAVPFITHRSADLLIRDTTSVNGVPTTNATRTLLDVGSVVHVDVLETLLSKILRDGGLPAPVRQFEVVVAGQRFRLDAAYPELMIFMEGDGFGVHSPRGSFERHRSRQNLWVVAGWLPLRLA